MQTLGPPGGRWIKGYPLEQLTGKLKLDRNAGAAEANTGMVAVAVGLPRSSSSPVTLRI